MKYILAALCFLCAALAASQTAKVISLSDKDAASARQAYENLQKAQKAWDDVQDSIKKHYLQVGYGDPEAGSEILQNLLDTTSGAFLIDNGNGTVSWQSVRSETDAERKESAKREEERRKKARYERKGWSYGFEFTSDFRYIVPKPEPVYRNPQQQYFLAPGALTSNQ